MIQCNCPKCNRPLRIGDGLAGRSIRCPDCKHKFRLPDEDNSNEPNEPAADGSKPAAKKKPKLRKTLRRKPPADPLNLRNRLAGGAAILVGMVLVIAGIGGFFPQGAIDRIGED